MKDNRKRDAAIKSVEVEPPQQPGVDLGRTLAVVTAALDIHRTGAGVDAVLEKRHGLDARRYSVLRLILGGCRYPSQVTEAMYLPPSGISRALNALAAERLIIRALDRDDSRRTLLSLTPKGEKVFEAATRSLSELFEAQLRDIGDAEFEGFLRTVEAFKRPPSKTRE